MYRTQDGQAFKSLDTLARTITHRAPGTSWAELPTFDPYWATISVEQMQRTVRTVKVPRGALMTWLRGKAPKVRAPRLVGRR